MLKNKVAGLGHIKSFSCREKNQYNFRKRINQ